MDIKILNNVLNADAKRLGACDKVMSKWTYDYSVGELLNLFLHNQEFCIEKEFPSNNFILANTSAIERNSLNVFINDKVNINTSGIYVIAGESVGNVFVSAYDAVTLYVRHGADINIYADGLAKVFIHVYDSASVDIEQRELSKVFVYAHGTESHITSDGDVIIRQK